jgi:hypothetical protein
MYKAITGMCVATLLFVCSATGFPVAPDSLPPSSGQLQLSPAPASSTFLEGAKIEVLGNGYLANSNITIASYTHPTLLGAATAGADGAFSVVVQLPDGLKGQHTLAAIGTAPDGSARVLEAKVRITPAPLSAGTLARTGFNVAGWTVLGVGLFIGGLVAVRTAALRRRILPVR